MSRSATNAPRLGCRPERGPATAPPGRASTVSDVSRLSTASTVFRPGCRHASAWRTGLGPPASTVSDVSRHGGQKSAQDVPRDRLTRREKGDPGPQIRRATGRSEAGGRTNVARRRTVEIRLGPARPPPLPTDRAVDHLPDEVGVAVVAGVFLDHVGVYPAQGTGSPRRRPASAN